MKTDDRTRNYPFIKNNFYPGKLLHASDFIREQEYGNNKLEFLNRKFHGYGIIEGLQVIAGSEGEIFLKPGSAIDGRGRLIVVPETVKLEEKEIADLTAGEFVLGIQYAEKEVGRERCFLEKEEVYQAAGIEETFALRAYTGEDLRSLQEACFPGALTEEKLIYEDERIRLSVRVPRIVPSDSVFRISLQIYPLTRERTEVKWHGICKLQGAVFLISGQNTERMDGAETVISGIYYRDWQLCTEEARRFPIIIELEQLKISSESGDSVSVENVRFCIKPTMEYGKDVQKYLDNMEERETEKDSIAAGQRSEEWIPLARLRMDENEGENQSAFHILKGKEVQPLAVRPDKEKLLRRIQEESGIVDIRWRGLLKRMSPAPPEPPEPPQPPRFRQGVAVISVPENYRKGQVLLSEEIFHGFSEKSVFVYCGRMHEGRNYEFWEKNRNKHFIISGQEALFDEAGRGGWYIEKQAVRQDIEAGSFRIAITLRKGRRRKRDREVAVSWLAVASG